MSQAQARVRGRLFADFNLSGGYDDSVLRDASREKSSVIPAHAGLGWRGRLSRGATARLYYRYSTRAYPQQSRETYDEHLAEASLKQRLYDPLSLSFDFEAELFRQPKVSRFDSKRFLYKPGLEWRVFAETALKVFFTHEAQGYPNFDLDSRAAGFELKAIQDVILDGNLSLRYAQRRRDYGQRQLFLNPAGALSSEKRRDDEREMDALLEGDWRYGGVAAGYLWAETRSNANLLDFGPNQTQAQNTALGDDRLIADHYSYASWGPSLEARLRWPDVLLFSASHRWQYRDYRGRIAKDGSDRFLAGEPKRSDRKRLLTLQLVRLSRWRRLTIGWTLSWSREQNFSNDTLYAYLNNRVFIGLRGWF